MSSRRGRAISLYRRSLGEIAKRASHIASAIYSADARDLAMFNRASVLDIGSSASTAALELARLVGANPIVFVVLDSAFDPPSRSHTSSSDIGEEDLCGKLAPEHAEGLKRHGTLFVDGCGGLIATRPKWTDRNRFREERFKSQRAIMNLHGQARLLYGGFSRAARTTSEWITAAFQLWKDMRHRFDEGRRFADSEKAQELKTSAE